MYARHMSTNNYLTKSAGKLFLIILIISSFALNSIAAGNTIYLVGEHHDNVNDDALSLALAKKAKSQKLLLGVEAPNTPSIDGVDTPCMYHSICDLNPDNQAYIASLDDTRARLIAHLFYFYSKLILMEMCEQILTSPHSPVYLTATVRSALPELWDHQLSLASMKEAFAMLMFSDKEWALWQTINQGPFFTQLTQSFAKTRVRTDQDRLRFFLQPFWLNQKITYSKELVLTLLNELQPILVQLTAAVLTSPEAEVMPEDFKNNLQNTETLLKNVRSINAHTVANIQAMNDKEEIVSGLLGDRLREFYMALHLQTLSNTAEALNVPLVAITGMDHTPGIYMFLKEMGFSVEVGLKENFLKLPQTLAHYAKSNTLAKLLQRRFAVSVGLNASDITAYFDQNKTSDPEAAAALEVINKYHDEL